MAPKKKSASKIPVHFRCAAPLRTWLDAQAKEQGLSLSEFVERLLWLAKRDAAAPAKE